MHLKQKCKTVLSFATVVSMIVMLFVSSCSASPASAATVYADTKHSDSITKETISLLEGLQSANRQVSAAILPSVVTLSVTEIKKVRNPLSGEGFPWFFFGMPNQNNGEKSDGNDN